MAMVNHSHLCRLIHVVARIQSWLRGTTDREKKKEHQLHRKLVSRVFRIGYFYRSRTKPLEEEKKEGGLPDIHIWKQSIKRKKMFLRQYWTEWSFQSMVLASRPAFRLVPWEPFCFWIWVPTVACGANSGEGKSISLTSGHTLGRSINQWLSQALNWKDFIISHRTLMKGQPLQIFLQVRGKEKN